MELLNRSLRATEDIVVSHGQDERVSAAETPRRPDSASMRVQSRFGVVGQQVFEPRLHAVDRLGLVATDAVA